VTRTRLPRPGEVVEHCRLCAAVLQISVENPRRVCAACGEVNLPNIEPALRTRRLPSPITSRELRLLPLGAAPVLLTVVAAGIGGMLEKDLGRAFDLWIKVAISVSIPSLLVSFVVAVWLTSKANTRALMASAFWLLGVGLAIPVGLLLTWLTALLHGLVVHR
jgi:hypothetical protein